MPNLCIIPARALTDRELTPSDLRALLAVGTFTSRDGSGVWASNATIADTAGLDERHLRRSLRTLEERGYLRRIKRPGTTSLLAILLDDPFTGEGGIRPGSEGAKSAPPGRADSAQTGGAKLAHQTTPRTTPMNEGPSPVGEGRPAVSDPSLVFDVSEHDDEPAPEPVAAAVTSPRRRAPAKPKAPAQFPHFTQALREELVLIWEEGVRPLANGEHGRLFATFGPFFRLPEAERPSEHPRDAEVMAALREILSARSDGLGGDKYGSPNYAAEKIRPITHILRECQYDPVARLDRVDRALGLRRYPTGGTASYR